MPRDDAQLRQVEIPTRVDVVSDLDDELSSEFGARASLAETTSEPQFRRAERRVSVRKGPLPRKTAGRVRMALVAMAALSLAAAAYGGIYRYGTRNWRFRTESSDDIAVQGLDKVTRQQVMDVLGADIGRNVFFIPLEQRRKQLEEVPWIESAAVMRLLPNRITVAIQERTPMAFAQIGNRVELVDAHGVIMEMPRNAHYSFPVITGLSEVDPLSVRSSRMKIYARLTSELDAGGAHYSNDLSEVDLGDPDDVKIIVGDPVGAVLVHLGNDQFLERYKIFLSHVAEWRQQFQKLESVDLRYDGQIIVNPEGSSAEVKTRSAKNRRFR
jgi:cell division protein FtsQ